MTDITRTSMLTGRPHTRSIPVDRERVEAWEASGREAYVQTFFHDLSDDDREFLLTGITPEEWRAAFPEGEGEE